MNIVTAFDKCLTTDSNGNYAVKAYGTTGDTPVNGNVIKKFRLSIDTTNNRVRVVSTGA